MLHHRALRNHVHADAVCYRSTNLVSISWSFLPWLELFEDWWLPGHDPTRFEVALSPEKNAQLTNEYIFGCIVNPRLKLKTQYIPTQRDILEQHAHPTNRGSLVKSTWKLTEHLRSARASKCFMHATASAVLRFFALLSAGKAERACM